MEDNLLKVIADLVEKGIKVEFDYQPVDILRITMNMYSVPGHHQPLSLKGSISTKIDFDHIKNDAHHLEICKSIREVGDTLLGKMGEQETKVPQVSIKEKSLSEMVGLISYHFENCYLDNDTIVIEEDYFMDEDEKNDDDCYDRAREIGELVVSMFPQLELSNYYCHRHKYAIANLKLRV